MSEDEATSILVNNLDGEQLADPRTVKFTTGMRKKAWNKNVLAIGLSGGFLEPLESTSIHMIQSVITMMFMYFPNKNFNSADIDRFNDQVSHLYNRVKDFIILHYSVTQRNDTDFWNYVRTMPVPESLTNKIDLYKSSGRILRDSTDLFSEGSWLQVLHGQGIIPNGYNALVDLKSENDILRILNDTESVIEKTVSMLTDHGEFISAFRAAPKI
jgi:tryptophan halogenase